MQFKLIYEVFKMFTKVGFPTFVGIYCDCVAYKQHTCVNSLTSAKPGKKGLLSLLSRVFSAIVDTGCTIISRGKTELQIRNKHFFFPFFFLQIYFTGLSR